MKKGNNIDLEYGANPNPMNERKQVALLFGDCQLLESLMKT